MIEYENVFKKFIDKRMVKHKHDIIYCETCRSVFCVSCEEINCKCSENKKLNDKKDL